MLENNLTIIFYTANHTPPAFAKKIEDQLLVAANGIPIISVSQRPMIFGENICLGDIGRSHVNIYRQALIGAKAAKTKYIAMAEDDTLYSPEHFRSHAPTPGYFAYNVAMWSIYTWTRPLFSYKGRRNLNSLICERDLFIETMEERFAKYPVDSEINLRNWAEPGKYEKNLGVTLRDSERFHTSIANVAFSHPTALSYDNLGNRKRLGDLRAIEIPYWGTAQHVKEYYA